MSELSELFDRDPLNLSDQDIAKIVTEMRTRQAQFELGVAAPVAARPKKAPTKATSLLKELGLE